MSLPSTETSALSELGWFRRTLHCALNIASHEWLLTNLKWPNGGDVILLRSVLVSLQAYLLALVVKNGLDPARLWSFSLDSIAAEILHTGKWYGPIFAGVYASLYSRYASQWNYLAGVYNRIKETEARGEVKEIPFAQWKAGFIEDADDLHVAAKPMFASTIRVWGAVDQVRKEFEKNTHDGAKRWKDLAGRIGILNPPAATGIGAAQGVDSNQGTARSKSETEKPS